SIQSVVNAQPAGATIGIRAGTHLRQQITPKNGQAFLCEEGAVLDGGGNTRHAFVGNSTRDVVIRGCTIQNYDPPAQWGVIHGQTGTGWPLTDGWVIEDNVIQDNGGVGIRTGDRMIVRNNRI